MACGRLSLAGLLVCLAAGRSPAQTINYSVSFVDPGGLYTGYYSSLTSHIQAAGAAWSSRVAAVRNDTIRVEVRFDHAGDTGSGRSTTGNFVGTNGTGGANVFEQGLAAIYRGTIYAPYRAEHASDVQLNFNSSYLQNQLWFDPNPTARTVQMPSNKTDAMSVMLHELGHAFAFNGWRDGKTGALPPADTTNPKGYMSTFDQNVVFRDGDLFFTGAAARAAYGDRDVPLTYGNYSHIGNGNFPDGSSNGRPGSDLVPDLMNGIVFTNGQRYFVSELDLAILEDTGLRIVPVPEPATVVVVAVLGLAVVRCRRRPTHALAA